MNRFFVLLVALAVVLSCSTASAGWRHGVAAAPVVVHSFYPVGPVYAYPVPAAIIPVPWTPVYVAPHAYVYPHRVVVRGRVYAHGRHGLYTVRVLAQ